MKLKVQPNSPTELSPYRETGPSPTCSNLVAARRNTVLNSDAPDDGMGTEDGADAATYYPKPVATAETEELQLADGVEEDWSAKRDASAADCDGTEEVMVHSHRKAADTRRRQVH